MFDKNKKLIIVEKRLVNNLYLLVVELNKNREENEEEEKSEWKELVVEVTELMIEK